MELESILIKNFRSIKHCELAIDDNCKILIGKNEAGKSNILKAIAAVFDQYVVSSKDKRKRILNEKIDEYLIRAVLTISEVDKSMILKRFEKKYQNSEIIKFKQSKSISDFINECFSQIVIELDIDNESQPECTYWEINKSDWQLASRVLVDEGKLNKEFGDIFDPEIAIYSIIQEWYKLHGIKCTYWQYSDEYILPNKIDIPEFTSHPNNFKALKNIFTLCNRGDIEQEFAQSLEEDGDYSNLLDQVSKETTKVFQGIWKDFNKTKIELIPNGNEEMLIKVVDKTKYSFEERSDGFKKFISILLMLSTRLRSKQLRSNHIILIDEPDQSLYPTSARYLRDELINISNECIVVYSTHSQYMIDSNRIDRHFIVEKIDDITSISPQIENSPFSNDELLRNAIGVSIFECIQPINIIFEGWLDFQLFTKYCQFNKIKTFDPYGKVYLRGISGHEALTQILILANKKFLIVADSDSISNEKRKEFEKNYPEFKNNWISYGEENKSIITMEDFIKIETIERAINSKTNETYVYSYDKNAIYNIEQATNKNHEKKQSIKNLIISELKKSDINESYNAFIESFKSKLDTL